ncbi:hypothetical protein JCM17961_15490 [Endothiovibrio diazotrophicus]
MLVPLLMAGCVAPQIPSDAPPADALAQLRAEPSALPAVSNHEVVEGVPYVPAAAPKPEEAPHRWLHRIQVGDLRVQAPIGGEAVMRMLRAEGITLTSTLPMKHFTYAGLGVAQVDAETALRVLLGGMGLDYRIDDVRRVVEVVPLPARTWTLNLGNRTASWNAGGASSSTSSTGDASAAAGATGATANASTTSEGSDGGGNAITAHDDVWTSFREELEQRLTRLTPCAASATDPVAMGTAFGLPPSSGMSPPPSAPAPTAEADCLFDDQRVGRFSVNPETGAVWVQAPRWLLDELDAYFTRVQAQYNTMITFEGRVILLSEEQGNDAGIDLQAITSWAGGRYGFGVINNVLGGVTLRLPSSGLPLEGTDSLPATAAGLAYQGDHSALQLFSAFLEEAGEVTILQRPLVATTSGVPGRFSKLRTTYYLNVAQTTNGSDSGAAVGTQNNLVPVELGTQLRVNPRWDPTTGLVRAQIELDQRVQTGSLELDQFLSGDGGRTVRTTIPLVGRQTVTGEVLLRDGDLIVLGGQSERETRTSASGLPGTLDGPFAWLTGRHSTSGRHATYFFALQVRVSPKGGAS